MNVPHFDELNTSPRILLGPGPSMVDPRVLRAISAPPVGHLDPEFLTLMNQVQQMLRYVFQTENELTIPVSGTGSAGMESAFCNFIEPGDRVLIAVNGYFGERMCDIAARYGAQVDRIDRPWGEIFEVNEIQQALRKHPYKLFALVHAETSTGALQQYIPEIVSAAHEQGALVVLDTVTSLGGVRVDVDKWDVDICYSGTQKCLSCPPGLAPITVGERARQALKARKTRVANWYLDLSMVEKYWGNERTYHHTAPINMNFALYEALRIVVQEDLEPRFKRHYENAEMLWVGLEELGMKLFVPHAYRLPSLTTVSIPQGIANEAEIRQRLLAEFNIEISGGLGPLKGKIWRIGLMGFGSRRENVVLLLAALQRLLHIRTTAS